VNRAAGRSGIEGSVEQPVAIRGSARDVYVAPGAVVHPMVVIDASGGPVYLDEGVEVHPFTRIEGPCYVGRLQLAVTSSCLGLLAVGRNQPLQHPGRAARSS
jgi:carbonic anhydrase/acetyltransferase-like protein (isoleucine patch superfamily)